MKKEKTFKMDYQQVKDRVAEEKDSLPRIVAETGIGMLVLILATIFLGR